MDHRTKDSIIIEYNKPLRFANRINNKSIRSKLVPNFGNKNYKKTLDKSY